MSDHSYTWQQIAEMLSGKPQGSTVTIAKAAIVAPEAAGLRKARGLRTAKVPEKTADWRVRLPGGGCLHVQDDGDDWVAHRDVTDPSVSLLGHALDDMPGLTVAGASVLGLALGGGGGALVAGAFTTLLAWGRKSLREQDTWHGYLSAPAATYEEQEKAPEKKPEEPAKTETTPAIKGLLTEGVVAEVVDIAEARRAREATPVDKAG